MIVAHSGQGVAHGSYHAGLQVPAPVEGVLYLPGPRIDRDGVDREVPPRKVVQEALPEPYLWVSAPLRVEIAPVRRDLDIVGADPGAYGSEPLPHRPQVF